MNHQLATTCLLLFVAVLAGDTSATQQHKHQITGLFDKNREDDLKATMAKLPQIQLISIDFANAEAVFAYDPAQAFPGARPNEIVERFDNLLRGASNRTFGVKPLRVLSRDRLKLIEIPVAGLDCKACCLAAYEAIYKLDGVEMATASFAEGRVTALIDPRKTDRAKVAAALKQRGVTLKTP